MAISPQCDFCKKELEQFGALLFSPPDSKSTVKKFHLCRACYAKIIAQKKG